MKKSYRWLFIFMIMAALSACTDHEDHLYGASGAGGEEVNPEATTEALELASITKYSRYETEGSQPRPFQEDVVAKCTFGWSYSDTEITTTGALSALNGDLQSDLERFLTITLGLSDLTVELPVDELGALKNPCLTGTLRTNYQGQTLSYELDLSQIEFRRNNDNPKESAGTLRLDFTHAAGRLSEIAVKKDNAPFATLYLSYADSDNDGLADTQTAEYKKAGADTLQWLYVAKSTYGANKLPARTEIYYQRGRFERIEYAYDGNKPAEIITTYYSNAEEPKLCATQALAADVGEGDDLAEDDDLANATYRTIKLYTDNLLMKVEKFNINPANKEPLDLIETLNFTYVAGRLATIEVQPHYESSSDRYEFEWKLKAMPTQAATFFDTYKGNLPADFLWSFAFGAAACSSQAGNDFTRGLIEALYPTSNS